ncbi:MAG: isoprenyl transferase [Candidatus Omnitrophota bacterium]|nr:isoprenyl transferase [Candidatus Omnitrophota bacterium]
MTATDTPTHIAIIMDGNRRWAKRHGFLSAAGHAEGVKAIERIIKAAPTLGVKFLTLYAFSTENWKRSPKEVDTLLKLLEYYLDTQSNNMVKNGVRFNTIGKIDDFPVNLRKRIGKVEELTKDNSRLVLNLALNYGGRYEIVEAARRIAKEVKENRLKAEDISEKLFSGYLYTTEIPDPDLLIRTSGELRLSNFLLWQASYSEIYITKKLWPDFGRGDLKKAIDEYKNRKRRLGG